MPAFGRPHATYRNLTDSEIDKLSEFSIDDILMEEHREKVYMEYFCSVAGQFKDYDHGLPKEFKTFIDDPDSRPMPYGDKTAKEVIIEAMKRRT